MNAKLFLDTNIIIDFIEQRQFELESTNKIFTAAEKNVVEIFICESTLVNTWYITGLDMQVIRLLPLVNFLSTQSRIIEKAFLSTFKDKEDAVLYYTALENKMDYFITRDANGFFKKHSIAALPVIPPKAAIKLLELQN